MTRIAVVGSSHVGCVRQSDGRIRAAWPDLDLAYFALPGAPFRRAGRDDDGVFRARPETRGEAEMVTRINGATEIDLAPFDLVWVIGHRYGMGRILRLFLNFDVLEMRRSDRPRRVSRAFADAAVAAEVQAAAARIAAQFGADPRVVCSAAPYPAKRVRAPGRYHEPPIAHMLQHPERDAVFADYQSRIEGALAGHGYGWLPQPGDTLAGPFVTQNAYLRNARDFRDPAKATSDLRHMNADYGFRLFEAYAEIALNASPSRQADATHEERT